MTSSDHFEERIAPALPADQWPYMKEQVASHRSGKLGWGIIAEIRDDGTLKVDVRGSRPSETWLLEPDERHALAALCLYGQKFGFTRNDVRLVQSMAELTAHYSAKYPDVAALASDTPADWRSLASRIAALLPPPDPTPESPK